MKFQWIIDRLKEPSTYAGIAGLLALLGKHVDPVKYDAVVNVGVAVGYGLTVALSEKK